MKHLTPDELGFFIYLCCHSAHARLVGERVPWVDFFMESFLSTCFYKDHVDRMVQKGYLTVVKGGYRLQHFEESEKYVCLVPSWSKDQWKACEIITRGPYQGYALVMSDAPLLLYVFYHQSEFDIKISKRAQRPQVYVHRRESVDLSLVMPIRRLLGSLFSAPTVDGFSADALGFYLLQSVSYYGGDSFRKMSDTDPSYLRFKAAVLVMIADLLSSYSSDEYSHVRITKDFSGRMIQIIRDYAPLLAFSCVPEIAEVFKGLLAHPEVMDSRVLFTKS